jgi:hypothetical protein
MLMLNVENSLIYLVGTQIQAVYIMKWQFVLLFKALIRTKASRCRLELSVPNFSSSESNHNYVKYQTETNESNSNQQIFFSYFLFY